jgi:AmmeMemoRadiSam system protein A
MSFPLKNAFVPEEQRAMLSLARSAIVGVFTGSPIKIPQPELPCFSLRRGVFVTVHVEGKLRGCIGVIEGREALERSIVHCAESAACRDPRFPPLRPEEIAGLEIEISVLSELFPISLENIEVGRHGLLVVSREKRGLLLPQVAVEHHLSSEQFVEETCRKAGLPRDAWRDPKSRLLGFTCEVFHGNGREID